MSKAQIIVVRADLSRTEHQAAVLELLNGYSMDRFADGKPLSDQAMREVIPGLQQHPTTAIFLAYRGVVAIGLAICFRGFSTFAARPLLNVHDFYVAPSDRGTGISRLLMEAIEKYAREQNCCKLTLEVLENNHRAKSVYAASGFAQSSYTPEAGGALFYSKSLT